jgi:hypothetical protein
MVDNIEKKEYLQGLLKICVMYIQNIKQEKSAIK